MGYLQHPQHKAACYNYIMFGFNMATIITNVQLMPTMTRNQRHDTKPAWDVGTLTAEAFARDF